MERKFTIFTLLYFVFKRKFQGQPPRGAYIRGGGDLAEGFFALRFWGAYNSRGLYMEGLIFGILRYSILSKATCKLGLPILITRYGSR